MIRQLSSLDAQFLAIEDDRQYGHVGSLAVFDPSTSPTGTLTAETVRDLVRQRLPMVPPLSWRLAPVPFGVDYPYWVRAEELDLSYHVREIALPAPGSDDQLATQVARLHSRPLDRARPLWELYVVSGLPEGRVALYSKIHHAVIDGVSGAEVIGMLFDLTADVAPVPDDVPAPLDPHPGTLSLLGRGVFGGLRHPVRRVKAVPATLAHLDETTFAALPGVARLGRLAGHVDGWLHGDPDRVVRPALPAPATPFSGKVSAHRSFAFGDVALDRVKAVKKAYGVTVNDVVVALCAGAVRRWLLEQDALPEEPLVAQVPVSVRTPEQSMTYGNRILMLGAPLHTQVADPVERLRRTSEDLQVMKTRHKALPADLLTDVNHFLPPALFSRAARLMLDLGARGVVRPTWNLVVSNVPGPQFDLYCAGAKLLATYPVSAVTDGLGLNITVMSYRGRLDIGVLADRGSVPDPHRLVAWMADELAVLEAAQPSS
ncbi:MAG: acyltransferase [Frankiales bacterium]|nr:acyltransferase [Frankiales bacterium]